MQIRYGILFSTLDVQCRLASSPCRLPRKPEDEAKCRCAGIINLMIGAVESIRLKLLYGHTEWNVSIAHNLIRFLIHHWIIIIQDI